MQFIQIFTGSDPLGHPIEHAQSESGDWFSRREMSGKWSDWTPAQAAVVTERKDEATGLYMPCEPHVISGWARLRRKRLAA